MLDHTSLRTLPNGPGVGYKPQHYAEIIEDAGPVRWLEIHAENYMGDGGTSTGAAPRIWQNASRFRFTAWVCLSVAKTNSTPDHLARLKHLVGWLESGQLLRTSGVVDP